MVPGVKKVLTSAFFIILITDDVIMTSRDVIMSDVGFFGLESFFLLISNYCASFKSIRQVLRKI